MNWTTRINRIVKERYPMREGCCLYEWQQMLRMRIERTDKIKRLIAGKTEAEQNEILTEIEEKYAISKEADTAK